MLIIKQPKQAKEVQSRRVEYMKDVFLWIRPLYANVLKEFREFCTITTEEVKYNQKTDKFEPVTKFDGVKFEDLLIDYILEKWEGIGDENKQPLTVSLESKKMTMNYLPTRDFVWAVAQSLDTSEAEAKNS